MNKIPGIILFISFLHVGGLINAQNVGIGTTTPSGPLSFNSILGNKIVLWGDGAIGHYGMGVQSGLLQFYADQPSSDISFGTGRSASFTERMRIITNGPDGMVLNGRIILKNGTSPVDGLNGGGVWMNKADNSALLGFMGAQNNQNIGFYGGPAGWGFTYDAVNSRVGIGNTAPNAPLAFPAYLGKKITLYPGATGDVGFAVAGNRLQIYSDNPNADVAIGYDAAGTFNERFSVKPNGALALVGNTGQAGQQMISGGPFAPAAWISRPNLFIFNRTGGINLEGNALCVDIPGINGQMFTIGATSFLSYQYSIPLFANNGAFGGSSTGGLSIQIVTSNGTVVAQGNTQFLLDNYKSEHIFLIGAGDLAAGTYGIRARVVRNTINDGVTATNSGVYGTAVNCNDIPIYPGQLLIQVFPK